jgi:hypothetical protein
MNELATRAGRGQWPGQRSLRVFASVNSVTKAEQPAEQMNNNLHNLMMSPDC